MLLFGCVNPPTFERLYQTLCSRCCSVVSLREPVVNKAVSQQLLWRGLPEGPASAGPIITALYLSGSFWAEEPTGERAGGGEGKVQCGAC